MRRRRPVSCKFKENVLAEKAKLETQLAELEAQLVFLNEPVSPERARPARLGVGFSGAGRAGSWRIRRRRPKNQAGETVRGSRQLIKTRDRSAAPLRPYAKD
jgi:hypothetical protein